MTPSSPSTSKIKTITHVHTSESHTQKLDSKSSVEQTTNLLLQHRVNCNHLSSSGIVSLELQRLYHTKVTDWQVPNGTGPVFKRRSIITKQMPKIKHFVHPRIRTYLRAKNGSTFFQKKGKMASEINASSEPFSRWNIKLSSTLISKGFEIENGVLEGNGVESFAITNSPKLQDRHTVWPWI